MVAPAAVAGYETRPTPAPPFAWPDRRPFLTAQWRNLVMLNYRADPAILAPLVPGGTELDFWQGQTFVSLVGFQFLRTRVKGLPVPFHTSFPEVNLRFYVRRRVDDKWRRGIVFVKELVPRRLIALVARACYGENYQAVPMSYRLEGSAGDSAPRKLEYGWRFRGQACRLALEPASSPAMPAAGSLEEFIAEHYWGYSAPAGRPGQEYEVAHPPWRVCPAATAEFVGDVAALYGDRFVPLLAGDPASAFWAEGSAVRVYPGRRLAAA